MTTVAAAAGPPELEAKRPEDQSWHLCQVFLKPSSDACTSSGLILNIEGQCFEEIIFSKEEAIKRLRIRSTPLQGDECFNVKEGEHVLASQTTKFGILFFDAEVQKVYGVRHSKRNPCRCTFRIKWLGRPGAQAETVPASSIMKLATATIDSHMTIVEFLNSFATFSCSGASSFASLSEEPDFEFDLEKQIEELSRLADVSSQGFLDGRPGELPKVDLTGQVRHRTLASQASLLNDQDSPVQNNSRRTTRSRKKILLESETIVSPPKSVTFEPDRPLLSPLGARAALASLIYKSPPMPEVSEYNVEREGFACSVQRTADTMISVDVNNTIIDSGPSTRKKLSIKDDFLPNVNDFSASVDKKQTKIRRSGRRDSSNRFLQTEEDIVGSKSESPRNPTKVTRSAVQKGTIFSHNEVELKSSKPSSPTLTHTPRFTRSTNLKETMNGNVDISKRPQEKKLAQGTNFGSTSLSQNGIEHSDDEIDFKSSSDEAKLETRHAKVEVLKNEAVNGTVDIKKGTHNRKSAQGTNSRSDRLRSQNGIEHSNDESDLKLTSEEPICHTPTPRFTRSAIHKQARHAEVEVLQKEAVNETADINSGLQDKKLAEGTNPRSNRRRNKNEIGHADNEIDLKSPSHTSRCTRSAIQKATNEMVVVNNEHEDNQLAPETCLDPIRGDFVTPQNKEIRGKKVLPSSDEEIQFSVAQETNKKQRVSKDKGEIADTLARPPGNNSISVKTSLILRSSPRTRSQKKSS